MVKLKLSHTVLPTVFLLAGCLGDSLPKISEDEITKSIQNNFIPYYTASYNDEGGGVGSVQVEVRDIRIGELTKWQLVDGKLAEDCWPVKANVRLTINYKKSAPEERKRGEWNPVVPNEGFCFYKNSFKEWAFQTGYL
jgi:hypothetical protein